MTLPLQGSILHVTKNITAMTRKSTRKECCRELPVGARQQTKTPNSPQSSFAEQIMWIEKIRDTRYLFGIMIT